MKDIKFTKEYASIPKDTTLKNENGMYVYRIDTDEYHYMVKINEAQMKKLIADGYAVEVMSQEDYEAWLLKSCALDNVVNKSKQREAEMKKLSEQLNAITNRAKELEDRYSKRIAELSNKDLHGSLKDIETLNREYICHSIKYAINYIMTGETNKENK